MEGTEVGGHSGPGGQLAQLGKRIARLAADKFEFDRRPEIQVQAIELLQEVWPGLTRDTRGALLATYSTLFPRCYVDDFPEECLEGIIRLPTFDDIYRALRVRESMYTEYKPDPGEEIYPSHGFLGDFLDYSKHNIVPTALYFWAGLAILGAACRRNFFCPGHDQNYRLSNYVLLTGPKGTGKSDARKIAIDVLRRANRKITEMYKAGHPQVPDAETYKVPIFGADVTAASLVEELAKHCSHKRQVANPKGFRFPARPGESLAIIDTDELGTFLGKDSHGAGTKVPMLVQMAFADEYRKRTKKGGEENADRLALSLLGCTAPEWMHSTVTGDALSGGFLDRLLLIHREPSTRWWPRMQTPIIDPVRGEKLADWLVKLMLWFDHPQTFLLTSEAEDFCNEWETRLHYQGRRDAGDVSKFSLPRLSLHLLKVAALLCVSEWDLEGPLPWIQLKHLELALLCLETEESYREEFMAQAEASGDEPLLQKILAFIRGMGGSIAKADFNQHGAFKRMDHQKRDYAIQALVARGDLVVVKRPGKRGRLVEFYEIPAHPPREDDDD